MNKFDIFVETVFRIKTKSEMKDFLLGILTNAEINEISNRLAIIKMLKKGIAQNVISENLGVGIATITRGSKELQKGRFQNV